MRKFILTSALLTICSLACNAELIQGEVSEQDYAKRNQIVDSKTSQPIPGAKINIPQKNYKTYTDGDGRFHLGTKIDGQTVMSVEKKGYKPFSLTINDKLAAKPLVLGIEKSTPEDITIETDMFHLGDNNFSEKSANAGEFQVKAIGPFYSKNFMIGTIPSGAVTNLVIGSIIGVDTKMAKELGQNRIASAYASPPEIYFNGNKIAEIKLNGDGQRIKIPKNLIRQNNQNEVTIKTGKNLAQTSYVDYDDIEFMNLSIETD